MSSGPKLFSRSSHSRPTSLLTKCHLPPRCRTHVPFLSGLAVRVRCNVRSRTHRRSGRSASAFSWSLEIFNGSVQPVTFRDQEGEDLVNRHSVFDTTLKYRRLSREAVLLVLLVHQLEFHSTVIDGRNGTRR